MTPRRRSVYPSGEGQGQTQAGEEGEEGNLWGKDINDMTPLCPSSMRPVQKDINDTTFLCHSSSLPVQMDINAMI